MKDIFATSLQPILEKTIGAGGYVERNMVLDKGDESRIADVLQIVQARHTQVYIKSRGQALAQYGQRLTVVLSCGGNDLSAARTHVRDTELELLDGLRGLGYAILDVLDS
jgi:molybdopterin-biosynthesis enzyme MoeA-like protein